ncbi:unnamed protein product [Paramecium sonneborni]|uniref:Uncharacterized protein n=1 Tax=Paramecium sonneborni TaxID=65129 RepID=A0A8S1MK34_9CILI|nr:unnamed protein product [Paramecium sonneborni]CAD8087250.1 unnamed protein product [Paramecium sonneborni]
MATQPLLETLPKDFHKMPPNYDFSHRGINWKDYEKDFVLRTDAVWEKDQLKDWFRLYTKCFYFDTTANKYSLMEPDDVYTILFEGWALEDCLFPFRGTTPTGRTNCFQVGLPPKQKVYVPYPTYQSQQDYFTLCALRFQKWFDCDQAEHFKMDKTEADYLKRAKVYPCYAMFYEAAYACTDDMFDFLMELAYTRRSNRTFEYNHFQHEMRRPPTVYDSPKNAERIKKTY